MDLLAIDLGNSRIKWGLWRAGEFTASGHGPYDGAAPAAAVLSRWRELPQCAVAIVSVSTDARSQAVAAWWRARGSQWVELIRASSSVAGVRSGYTRPERLGADRWAAIAAAYELHGGPVCVASAGTALTVDAVAADGRHLGGAIIPGLSLMREALGSTALVGVVGDAGVASDQPLGRDTAGCVVSGTVQAAVGLIERTRRHLEYEQGGQEVQTVITGGDGAHIQRWIGDAVYDPMLTLRGVVVLALAAGLQDAGDRRR